jgi:hypothetical protein
MVRADDIRALKTAVDDYAYTERLKADLCLLREKRKPLFLTRDDLDPIFMWKLGGQYHRVKRHLGKNSDRAYEIITKAAFSINESDWKLEADLRLGVLTSLHGVGVPVASAILALTEPERYCVIDFRGWRAVFDEEKREFDNEAYIGYSARIKELAQDLGWSAQETDAAVWEYDRRRHPKVSISA